VIVCNAPFTKRKRVSTFQAPVRYHESFTGMVIRRDDKQFNGPLGRRWHCAELNTTATPERPNPAANVVASLWGLLWGQHLKIARMKIARNREHP
jgi:hypothetical protein